MKKLCAAILSGLLMSSIAFAAPGDNVEEGMEEQIQMSEQVARAEQNLDNITVYTYIIQLSEQGKAKVKKLSQGKKQFISALPGGNVNLEDYGTLIAPVASFNIDVGKRIESRQSLAPVLFKLGDRVVTIGGVDDGLKFNIEYIEHKDNTVTLNSEVFLLSNKEPKEQKDFIFPDTHGQYLTFAQNMPIGMGVVAGGFQKIGNTPAEELKDIAVIQVAYDQAPEAQPQS